MKERIEKQIEEYKKQIEQHNQQLVLLTGAIQALERLLKEEEKKG